MIIFRTTETPKIPHVNVYNIVLIIVVIVNYNIKLKRN